MSIVYFANLCPSDVSVLLIPDLNWVFDPQLNSWQYIRKLAKASSFHVSTASDLVGLFNNATYSSTLTEPLCLCLDHFFKEQGIKIQSQQSRSIFDIRDFQSDQQHLSPDLYWVLLEKPQIVLVLYHHLAQKISVIKTSKYQSWISDDSEVRQTLPGRLWQPDTATPAHHWKTPTEEEQAPLPKSSEIHRL